MFFNPSSIATLVLLAIAIVFSVPVLARGFQRRGKGVKYESNFVIQRAPQLASLFNIALVVVGFIAFNKFFAGTAFDSLMPVFSMASFLPENVATIISWIGVAELLCGFIFMIGGWYSLGEAFSTDAELLHGQTIRKDGLLKYVMHPAYSGIIQSLLGASIACNSLLSLLFTIAVVAPLWLNRAQYEERLLIETFGEQYKDYGKQLGWRRLIPTFIPIGV